MNAFGAADPQPKPIIHIVEDDALTCQSLARLFGSVGVESHCHFSPADFLQNFDPTQPGCILLDVRLPGMSGLDLHEAILKRKWTHAVVFLTGLADVPIAVRAMKAGAVDFLQKPFNEQALIETVTSAAQAHAEFFRKEQRGNEIRRRAGLLSPREREVLGWVVAGQSTRQIAHELGLSSKTVDNHRASILDKMQAGGVVELVRLVLMACPEMVHADASPAAISFITRYMSKAS